MTQVTQGLWNIFGVRMHVDFPDFLDEFPWVPAGIYSGFTNEKAVTTLPN